MKTGSVEVAAVAAEIELLDSAEVTSEVPPGTGYTAEQVARGEYPPLLSLLPPELAAEVSDIRINGEPLVESALRLT